MTPHTPKSKPPAPKQRGAFVDEASDAVDVQRIHMNIVGREKMEPDEGFETTPWWVWSASVVLLFAMGFYLGRYSGSFSAVAHEVEQPQAALGVQTRPEAKGDLLYAGVCQPCHQSSGMGLAGQYPPLAGSEWLLQDKETPIRILLHGLQGEITVKGNVYNNRMPPFQDKLANDEIAAVLTHARSSWGNRAGAISAADVDSLRSGAAGRGPWSAGELEALRKKKPS